MKKKQRKAEIVLMSSLVKYIGLVIILALGLTGCGAEKMPLIRNISTIPSPDGSPLHRDDTIIARQEIRLGLLLPLSGPDAAIGTALLNAATLALFDSGDGRLALLPYDTRGTAQGAGEAMKILLMEKPDLVIGPVFSPAIRAIKALAAGITVIGFSSDYAVAGDGIFLMNFPMEEQIERVIRYASGQGYARYAALVPETAYGSRALEVFRAGVTGQNRELTSVEFYPPDSNKLVGPVKSIANYRARRNSYTGEIRFLNKLGKDDDFAREMLDELKNTETLGAVNFDALLLPEGGTMLTTLAAWVSYYEIDPAKIKILGTGLWDDKMIILEPQLYGGWFAAPDHKTSRKFLARYRKTYGQDGPRLITLAYDAVALAATLIRHEITPDFSPDKLTGRNGFSGIDGLFRFSPSGLIERGLAVYEVGAKEFTVIDPAPESFIDQDRAAPLGIRNAVAGKEDYSEAATPGSLPINDGRPFPYNPVQQDAVNIDNQ